MKKKIFTIISLLLYMVVLVSCETKEKLIPVYFNTNGGSYIQTEYVAKNSLVTKPTDPLKDNYTFTKWYKDDKLTEEWDFLNEKVVESTTLHAGWKQVSEEVFHNVKFIFDENNLDDYEVEVVSDESKVKELEVPQKDGFVFLGWYLGDEVYDFNNKVTEDIVLIAKWHEILDEYVKVTVDYNDNKSSNLVISVKVNTKIDRLDSPEREGYTFLGWYLGDEQFNFDLNILEDIKLVAQWREKESVITTVYEHDFGKDGLESNFLSFPNGTDIGANYGQTTYDGVEFTQGYKFDSKGKIDFTTEVDNLELILVVGLRDGKSSALGVNGEKYDVNTQGQVINVSLETAGSYSLTRYSNSNAEFGVFYISVQTTEATPELVQIEFDSNGGSLVNSQTIIVGDYLVEPEEPVHETLDFVGWYLNDELFNFNTILTSDTTLVAKWEKLDVFEVKIDGKVYEVKDGKYLEYIKPEFIEGKVFVNYYDEANNEFDFDNPINKNYTVNSVYRDAEDFQITYVPYAGNLSGDKIVTYYEYEDIVLKVPEAPVDHVFVGWFTDEDFTNQFDLERLEADVTLYAKYISVNESEFEVQSGAYLESVWATWDSNSNNNLVYYREYTQTDWILVDSELVRKTNTGEMRVDIVGLKEGLYDLLIVDGSRQAVVKEIYTEAHDRSGYAHFNYTEGIGAYKDDGTLKDDAIVIYVTEENKDSITIPGIGQVGLGWILNNAQYSSSTSNTHNIQKYNNSIATFDKPIAFRFIGKVTTPEGATVYDSTDQGGSKGDNGHMLRMKDGKNITIEGIGEDAVIYGWGMHFMASTVGRGVSFEARNLTFDKYPEDALGLEGIQSGSELTVPVQRGWMHNLTFYSGYSANPAESDKGSGDGSLDIKRGEYFTVSYNQFIGAHKTNLIGASNSNLQYHFTYHHNLWRNNASRIPLARQANIHMYNNVFETTDDNTGENGYAQNTRADAYIFSEANYFYGTKRPSKVDGGAIKSFGDIKYSTYEHDEAVVVNNRDDKVVSGNKFEHFDTNSDVFYYDSVNKKSDVKHLTDAVTAKAEVYIYSGTYKVWEEPNIEDHKVTDLTPELINTNVTRDGAKIEKGIPLVVFEITKEATFNMSVPSVSYQPVLVTIYGELILFGEGTVTLKPGVYVVESERSHGASKGQSQAKESRVDSYTLTFS